MKIVAIPRDDAVQAKATRLGLPCFRGSVEDVLGRYYCAAMAAAADAVVRVTSDCSLFDGTLLNHMLVEFRAEMGAGQNIDYMSNVIERTYPRGLDAEIFTMAGPGPVARPDRKAAVAPHA